MRRRRSWGSASSSRASSPPAPSFRRGRRRKSDASSSSVRHCEWSTRTNGLRQPTVLCCRRSSAERAVSRPWTCSLPRPPWFREPPSSLGTKRTSLGWLASRYSATRGSRGQASRSGMLPPPTSAGPSAALLSPRRSRCPLPAPASAWVRSSWRRRSTRKRTISFGSRRRPSRPRRASRAPYAGRDQGADRALPEAGKDRRSARAGGAPGPGREAGAVGGDPHFELARRSSISSTHSWNVRSSRAGFPRYGLISFSYLLRRTERSRGTESAKNRTSSRSRGRFRVNFVNARS